MTSDYSIGQVLNHPEHGECEVTFVGRDYLGVRFPDGQHALLRKESFEAVPDNDRVEAGFDDQRNALPWPDNTFVHEPEDAAHFMGTHWRPFYDDSAELLERLPEISGEARALPGFIDVREPPRALPDGWVEGAHCFWPTPQQGLVYTLRAAVDHWELCSVYPFSERGTQATLELDEVVIWNGGVEAQINALWMGVPVTFFDTQYLSSRLWYERGRWYDFLLTAFAYSVQPAVEMEMPIDLNVDQVAWEAMLAERHGDAPPQPPKKISLAGMSMFLPAEDGDVDEYGFRGPVKSLEPFTDFLGQPGWWVRVTVMRVDDEDADLEIVVTRRAWSGPAPLAVGQDVEGIVWLQGRVWNTRT